MATQINHREGSLLSEYLDIKKDQPLELTLDQDNVTVQVIRGLRVMREMNADVELAQNDSRTGAFDTPFVKEAYDWIQSQP